MIVSLTTMKLLQILDLRMTINCNSKVYRVDKLWNGICITYLYEIVSFLEES